MKRNNGIGACGRASGRAAWFAVALLVACSSSDNGGDGSGGSGGNAAGKGGANAGSGGSSSAGKGGSGTAGSGGSSAGSGGAGSGGNAGGATAGKGGGSGGAAAGTGGGPAAGSGGSAGAPAGSGGQGGVAGTGGGGAPAGGAAGGNGGQPGTAGASGKFGDAQFIAISRGQVFLTKDGKAWTESKNALATNSYLTGACVGGGLAMAMVHDGTPPGVYTSEDGLSFKLARDGLPAGEDCIYGGGLFTGGNMYSTDKGVTWQDTDNMNGVGNKAFVFGKGVFVGAGSNDTSWSTDGKVWKHGKATDANAFNGVDLYSAAFGGTKFVVASYKGDAYFESSDGQNWTPSKSPPAGEDPHLGSAVGKIFVTVGNDVYWLDDAQAPGAGTWTKVATSGLKGVVGGTATLAITGTHYSTDGVSWTPATTPIPASAAPIKILPLK